MQSTTTTEALIGFRILLTRPAHQAMSLAQKLTAMSAVVDNFPTITIEPPGDLSQLTKLPMWFGMADKVIFTSANAVHEAMQRLTALLPDLAHWPEVFCIGPATKKALEAYGCSPKQPFEDFSSEGLLTMSAFTDPMDQRILILTGEQPRSLLADVLTKRGARAQVIYCYRREKTRDPQCQLAAMVTTLQPNIVVCSSRDALVNLFELVSAQSIDALFCTTLLLSHVRMTEKARDFGHKGPILVAENATEAAMIKALCVYHQG